MDTTIFPSLKKGSLTAAALGLAMAFAATVPQTGMAAEGYKKIKTLGGTSSAVCRPPISTADDLQNFFRTQSKDVMDILGAAGFQGDSNDLFSAIEAGDFTEKSYAPGTRMEWMGFRRGKGLVAEPREWAGEQAFEAFEVRLESLCMNHTLIIPKDCCNLATLGATAVSVNEPRLTVVQTEDVTTVTALGDCDATTVELTRSDGSVEPLPLTDGKWEGSLAPGDYTITATSECECGTTSTGQTLSIAAPAVAAVVESPAGGLYLAPFLGREIREVDPLLVGIDVGYAHPIAERVDAFIQGGVSYNTKTNRESVYVDVGLDRKVGETGFIGAGVGRWDLTASDEDNVEARQELEDTTYFIHGGADTPWVINGNNVQWFLEGRIFAEHTDNIGDHNIIKAGIRIKP